MFAGTITRALIVGAGEVGTALFNAFIDEPQVNLTGMVDGRTEFTDFALASAKGVPIFTNIAEAMQTTPDIVFHLPESGLSTAEILNHKPAHTEIIEIQGVRMFLHMIAQSRKMGSQVYQPQEEIMERLADASELYHLGVAVTAADSLNEALSVILREALRVLGKPAGSIALYDDKTRTFTLKAFEGFTEALSRESSWKTRKGGLTDHILSQKSPTVINDIKDCPFVDESETFLDAGIRSLVAVPFFAEARMVGILYIDDFIPREWTAREIDFLVLLGAQAAFSIEKFKLIANIKETQNYLQSIFDNSADIIVTTDSEMRVVEFNGAAEKILGYSRAEVVGTSAEFAWLHPEERKGLLQRMNEKGYISNYEAQFKTKNGTIVDMDLTLSYIRDCNGRVVGTVGISRDITDKKRLERTIEDHNRQLQELNESLEERVIERTTELREANQELARMNKVKSEFIATMSHELRTPLNSILGFSELLKEDNTNPLTDKQKRYATNIHASGAHLLQLINNILDLAKIESGKFELQCESVSLQKIISDVDSVIRPLTDKKSQQFEIFIPEEIIMIRVDRMKFVQILYNLLSNAMKFTPQEGRITLEATIRQRSALGKDCTMRSSVPDTVDNYLELRITDTGIGIREEDQARIFSEFEQVDSSYARHYEGTGLGLALTKRLVELHGGHVSVMSDYGQGSIFTVIVPLVAETVQQYNTLENEEAEAFAFDENFFNEKQRQGALVLLVEDDPATAELMTHYLTQGGYRISHVFNGDDVLKRVRELKPFAILLDIMLPGKDGWQILQEIKSDPDIKDIPVIIISIID
ncbi:MAG: PAS domain S-box protein, partial [Syntrophaceae bacterium]|nr:PAS domain S-box protein [Syntrophaceae bacterium]